MKRHGHLYTQITDFTNLLTAAQNAQRSKRFRPDVLAFNNQLAAELLQLKHELTSKTYRPGSYRTFHIAEPKLRVISAAPYRDRVVHHALCQIIDLIFDRTFIHHSYANRIGFGTHRALKTFTQYCRSSRFVLQCDIRKYFPNIDHEILKTLIRRKIKCPDTLWLIDTIIDNSNDPETVYEYFPQDDILTPLTRRRGLPIGNLTSQFFANIYLNPLDHFIKETLKIKRYLRYADDFALFGNDHEQLAAARPAIENFLADLRLRIHPIKSQLFETRQGANFVGFRILPHQIRVRSSSLQRSRRRYKGLQLNYRQGYVSLQHVLGSLRSWNAHLAHGNTKLLRRKIFASLVFVQG